MKREIGNYRLRGVNFSPYVPTQITQCSAHFCYSFNQPAMPEERCLQETTDTGVHRLTVPQYFTLQES